MNFMLAFFRIDHHHTDHIVASIYKTLKQLIGKSDLTVQDFGFTFLEVSLDTSIMNLRGKIMYVLFQLMTNISPVFSESILEKIKK